MVTKNKEDASDRNITIKIPESFTLDNDAEGELTSADRVIGIYKAEADSKDAGSESERC